MSLKQPDKYRRVYNLIAEEQAFQIIKQIYILITDVK